MLNKKTVYLLLAMFLCALLADIIYDGLEISYLNASLVSRDAWYIVYGKSLFAFRPLPEIVFDLAGAFGGYYVG